jgi:MoxR-like ATPase
LTQPLEKTANNLPSAPLRGLLDPVVSRVGEIIIGREEPVRLALTCLLAGGHLLIEDVPGVGKTTLAQTLARTLGLDYVRIQFTSDLLPADVIGVSIYDNQNARFRFHPGPVFSQLVLADEINRATPKAQSALLEAMEEKQVSTDAKTYPLPKPFFVVATQNPRHQIGTFPLPESQLDRFLMRIRIGYPDARAERALLKGRDRREVMRTLEPVIDPDKLIALQQHCQQVHCSDALIDYVQALLEASRTSPVLQYGLSPRAGIALTHAARAWAYLAGRTIVLPEDIQAVAQSVLSHRLQGEESQHTPQDQLVQQLVQSVPIP